MTAYAVIGTQTYKEEIAKWSKEEQERANELPIHLAENPGAGKPLSYPFLREKRISEKRMYFLVYDDLRLVLLVAAGGKKDQKATINHLKSDLPSYRVIAEKVTKQVFQSDPL